MKTYRTCGECRNGQIIDFVCTKKDIAVCIDNTCKDFVPKRTCGECRNCEPREQTKFLCAKNKSGIEVAYPLPQISIPKSSVVDKLEALDRFELMALLEDYAIASTQRGVKNLVEYLDSWHRHS